jgi:hypothetical protein
MVGNSKPDLLGGLRLYGVITCAGTPQALQDLIAELEARKGSELHVVYARLGTRPFRVIGTEPSEVGQT